MNVNIGERKYALDDVTRQQFQDSRWTVTVLVPPLNESQRLMLLNLINKLAYAYVEFHVSIIRRLAYQGLAA